MQNFGKKKENIVCENCGIEKNEKSYYFSKAKERKYMNICKDCFINEFNNSKNIFEFFKKYDIPFFESLWDCANKDIRYYLQKINSLPQYKELRWEDSKIDVKVSFYDSIVNNLKKEADKLNEKLTKIRDINQDMNLYISTLKSLRETLILISQYDWQLKYSNYGVVENGIEVRKEVSVWEQNHENQIRNHKVWIVVESKNDIDINAK